MFFLAYTMPADIAQMWDSEALDCVGCGRELPSIGGFNPRHVPVRWFDGEAYCQRCGTLKAQDILWEILSEL